MKKTGWILSLLLVCFAGMLIFTGVFYLEKKEKHQKEEEAKKEKQKAKEKEMQASSQGSVVGDVLVEDAQRENVSLEERTTEEQGDGESVLVFAGDVYLSRHVEANYDGEGIDGVISPSLLEEMQGANLCMVNEEFPFGTVGTPMEDKQYTFRVNPFYVSLFEDMGVDIVSLANNHVLDYGTDCLKETFETLEQTGIAYVGAGNTREEASALKTYDFNGETYGILSASRVIPVPEWNIENRQPGVFTTYDETALVEAIKRAEELCDYVIVYVHWGVEHTTELEEHQTYLAHAYADAGADLILGSHSHNLQGIESYNGSLIFYGLGNYIFNQSIEKTMLVKLKSSEGEKEISLIPAYAAGAKTVEYENREEFFSYLEGLSPGIQIKDGVVLSQ
ncbi:MAG: CapA family protein [Lachnospiraceae bacterium]|nr:CapA family protein [Lachnospiraceae bacterium]